MKQNSWIRTLLRSYNYLERLVKGIDKMVKKISYNSYHYNSYNYQSAFDLSNRIIDLNERKVLLINTKVLVDEMLKYIGKEGAKYLTLRYIDGLKNEDVATSLKKSVRTVSRNINNYIEKAEFVLKKYGLDSKELFKLYKDEQWILDMYYGDNEW